jgi:hypothetical protein
LEALFYVGVKGMSETMFLHFVPVDGVECFSGIFGQERYVVMFLCFQKSGQGLTWAVTYVIGLHAKLTILGECDVASTTVLGMLVSNKVLTVDTRDH